MVSELAIILIVAAVCFIFVCIFIALFNSLVTLKNQVKNAYSQIKVQLKRRHDLIPNLVETVKGYMQHESDVLQKVTEARTMACNVSSDAKTQAQNENNLSSTLKTLFAVCESYPDLKANTNFLQLQEELVSTENKLSFARQFYNDSVMQYNIKKETFPSNIIASIMNFELFELFELESADEAKPVNVKFN